MRTRKAAFSRTPYLGTPALVVQVSVRSYFGLLGGYAFVALEGRVQCMPAERSALDACGELKHSGEYLQPPEMAFLCLGVQSTGHHLVKFVEQFLRLGLAAPFYRLRHHRGGCF